MADPICRWRNSSIKQVSEFALLFPFEPMAKVDARRIVANRWELIGGKDFFTTPYQLAAEMGIYYEDDVNLIPRFSSTLSLEQANIYLQYWGRHYYAPNPYTKSMDYNQQPVIINNFLVNWVLEHETALWSEALDHMFTDTIGNTDILVNMINNFTEVNISDNILSLKNPDIHKYEKTKLDVDPKNKQVFFEYVGSVSNLAITKTQKTGLDNCLSGLQQIFYGAPGTGKSHTISEKTEGECVIRTTFHPDCDYSTFVGCYKPTMINNERKFSKSELISKLAEIKSSGVTYPCHKFAAKYWESLQSLSTESIKSILSSCGFTDSMNVEISKGVAIGQELASTKENGKIIYAFTPQAFTKAYIKAWTFFSEKRPVYLVIEEINRGNCAQIFGDLFQLLDRDKRGYSKYMIVPDTDLQKYINENAKLTLSGVTDEKGNDISDVLNSGEILVLPPNLFIWATMNTSDQSLFPIDSAFKRRWDWKYVPIDTSKESWRISANGKSYDWSDFLDKINAEIEETTTSEDKMLGFYFCKADNNVISAEKFVGKVIFYLWNDVFKDYGFDKAIFDDEKGKLTFRKFYKKDGKIDESKVERFLNNLGIQTLDLDETNGDVSDPKNKVRYSLNGQGDYSIASIGKPLFEAYMQKFEAETPTDILNKWTEKLNLPSKTIVINRTDGNPSYNYIEIECGEGVFYYHNYWKVKEFDKFVEQINALDWGITIAKL